MTKPNPPSKADILRLLCAVESESRLTRELTPHFASKARYEKVLKHCSSLGLVAVTKQPNRQRNRICTITPSGIDFIRTHAPVRTARRLFQPAYQMPLICYKVEPQQLSIALECGTSDQLKPVFSCAAGAKTCLPGNKN